MRSSGKWKKSGGIVRVIRPEVVGAFEHRVLPLPRPFTCTGRNGEWWRCPGCYVEVLAFRAAAVRWFLRSPAAAPGGSVTSVSSTG